MTGRVLAWISTGAASLISAKLAMMEFGDRVIPVRCETGNEDEDNYRFERDGAAWLGREITIIKSADYESVPELWEKRRFMASRHGAICTAEMKIAPRLAFQRPDDLHVFGYTSDRRDIERYETLKGHFFELRTRAPLIEAGLNKAATLAMVEKAGIALPRTYAMGFPNANCLQTGCVKATSPNYWSLFRQEFPDRFARTARLARDLGVRLARIREERVFIDDIPADWPTTQAISPACDFLCMAAEMEYGL